ncbi:MAG: LytTR family DNA-binding domain-containing protein [Clostridium sp.]|nr:LytTR family DNA-binding domain-containing protein [Clostridium sp.]
MLQIAICDDELFYQEKIQRLLERYLESRQLKYNIRLFSSGEEFSAPSESQPKYDIVFMDISMDKLDGISAALRMRSFHTDTFLVFVTAFIDYALEGYKADAIRYILKDTLDTAIAECMDAILQKMYRAYVSFSFLEGEQKLYADNLLYIESRKHKSIFYYRSDGVATYQIYDKLDSIEQKLSGYGFLRIHKSYLVNMKHLQKIANYTAYLDTGEELPVPRSRFQSAKKALTAYKGAM